MAARLTVTRSFNGNLDASFSKNKESRQVVVDDCEMGIFDAQKYFNEGNNNNSNTQKRVIPYTRAMSENSELPRFSSASSIDSRNNINSSKYRIGSFHATPTASSEASWNSQTGLLSNPPGSIKVSLRNVPTTLIPPYNNNTHEKKTKTKKKTSWFFGRRFSCPCTGGKPANKQVVQPKTIIQSHISSNTSIQSKFNDDDDKTSNESQIHFISEEQLIVNPPPPENPHLPLPGTQSHRITATGRSFAHNAAGFSFPILSHPMTHYPIDDPPRESLEVFRPFEDLEPSSRTSSLDLHHSRDRRSFTFPASPKSRMTTVTDDEVASDASSDLFEIESFSTQTTTTTCPVLYRHRDSLEDDADHLRRRLSAAMTMGGGSNYYAMAETECYEPSEASIDWSVTTAEGFERASSVTSSAMVVGECKCSHWSCRCKKAVVVGEEDNNILLRDHNHHQIQITTSTSTSSSNRNRPPLHNNNKPPPPPPLGTTTRFFHPFAK